MGKPSGFLEYPRKVVPYRDPKERVGDFNERVAWIAASLFVSQLLVVR
jgi:hypothetical protein